MEEAGFDPAHPAQGIQFKNSSAEEGQSLIELALLLPVLLLIMAGALDLGRAFQANVTVANAAREGARYASLNASLAQDPATLCSGIQGRVEDEAAGSGIDLSTNAEVRVCNDSPCTSSPGDCSGVITAPGSVITVEVAYPFQPITGLILGGQTLTINASVSMVQF